MSLLTLVSRSACTAATGARQTSISRASQMPRGNGQIDCPSFDQIGKWLWTPGSSLKICRALEPSRSAMNVGSPASYRWKTSRVPSGDHAGFIACSGRNGRSPPPSRGARRMRLPPTMLDNQMSAPSGVRPAFLTSTCGRVPCVRLTKRPLPTWLTQVPPGRRDRSGRRQIVRHARWPRRSRRRRICEPGELRVGQRVVGDGGSLLRPPRADSNRGCEDGGSGPRPERPVARPSG